MVPGYPADLGKQPINLGIKASQAIKYLIQVLLLTGIEDEAQDVLVVIEDYLNDCCVTIVWVRRPV